MDRSGKNVIQLTENESHDAMPDWSPDGASIVFSGNDDLYVMAADGSDVKKIIGGPAPEWYGSFSPNGRRILFMRNDSISTVRPDGTDVKRLTSRRRMFVAAPEWSHDGRRILFQRDFFDSTGMDIWVMRRDGSHKKAVITAPGDQQTPSWSPNDRRIAFSDSFRVAVARADGSRRVPLFDHDLADYSVDWGSPVRC
jgi:TolB protein